MRPSLAPPAASAVAALPRGLPSLARRLPWPLPALLAWALAWSACIGAGGASSAWGFGAGVGLGFALAMLVAGNGRRLWVAAGFPLSAMALGAAVPAWGWAAAAVAGLAAYPLSAWRDAPFFPTRAGALAALPEVVRLEPGARVLDAGCGLGHGLAALRDAFPQARVEGVERSWLLALAARWRCSFALVRRGDMWASGWGGCSLVYLFQRPESMARAMAKARSEMAAGAWLVSLEFEVPGATPHARLAAPTGQPVWVYRVGGARRGRARPN